MFATPAVIVPGALNRFVFGKLFVAAVGVALASIAPGCGRLSCQARILLGCGGVLLALAAVTSASPVSALLGRAPMHEGALVLPIYLLAGVSGARLLGPRCDNRATRVVLATMSLCMLLIGFVAVLESLGLRPLSTDLDRPGSLLGTASDEGAIAVLYAGPLLMHALRERRPLIVAGTVAALLTAVLSASRGALIGVVVVAIIIALCGSRSVRVGVLAAVGGVAAAALSVPFVRDRLLGLSPLSGRTASGRDLLWRESLSLLAKHPVLGVGPSQFEVAIVGEHDRSWQSTIGPLDPPASPHNWILQAVSAGGVLLLVVLVWLIALLIRSAVRLIRSPEHRWALGVLAGLGGYGAALLFHFTSIGTTIPACVLAGSLLSVAPAPVSRADPWLRRFGFAMAGVLAVCFLLASASEIWLKSADDAVTRGNLSEANSDYTVARTLRIWDVDLPGQPLYRFVKSATAGNSAAIPYAKLWLSRTGAVAADEQVIEDHAALFEASGDYRSAARILDAELHIDPDNPMMLILRGVVFARLGEYPAAESTLEHAASIDPTNPQPWQDLSAIYAAQGKSTLSEAARSRGARLAANGH